MSNKIYIPKHTWNTYEPPAFQDPNRDATHAPTPRIRLKLNLPSPPQNSSSSEPDEEARTRTRCKIKLARFHYGGPQRQQQGQWRNRITFEQPCLHPTCPRCLKWHADIMRKLTPEHVVEEGHRSERKQDGGLSSGIHPRLLDKTPLVEQATTSNVPAETTWRSTPRESYTVRLLFRSDMGKMVYRRMFGLWDPQERKRICERARRAIFEEANCTRGRVRHNMQDKRNRHVIGGYKVKLVFLTKQGKAAFAEIVRVW
ncbi:hypothetical protein KJE20_04828 [Pyrenophora tritici-repentis]|nr:hypothetical protein KJE20_04828 [Pyrenophora tritici-repentis]